MTFKQKIYQHYISSVNNKIDGLQKTLDELSESAKNETKSTAGDKHETALAMLQIEQENTRNKLQETQKQKLQLEQIDIDISSSKIGKGSLVQTNHGYFFISIALEKVNMDDKIVIAISPQSPLGSKLSGLSKGGNHYHKYPYLFGRKYLLKINILTFLRNFQHTIS